MRPDQDDEDEDGTRNRNVNQGILATAFDGREAVNG